MATKLNLDKMITIDNSGIPVAPSIKQIQDKDVALLWVRDKTKDKINYVKEAGVIYYLGDPKSPVRQRGLSDKECLQEAIINFNLPNNYVPDSLVSKLIKRYYDENITEAGIALEALHKSLHLVSIAAVSINDILNNKIIELKNGNEEAIASTLSMIDSISKRIIEIPALTKSLASAYENLRNEEESQFARGGVQILSSMIMDDN